ncbi:MAG TPA: M3 family metallopeptidase, partial [Opitutaceae bacterium]
MSFLADLATRGRAQLVAATLAAAASFAHAQSALPMTGNPLLDPSPLPFGYPAFDRIRVEHFRPALEQGMAEQLREIDAIAHNAEAVTFENTIVALERAGRRLGTVQRIFGNLNAAHTNDALRALDKEFAPKAAAHSDAIRLNPALFARIEGLHRNANQLRLDPESRYLLDRYYKDFVRAGAKLSEPEKARLRVLNAEIASLQTAFSQSVLAETNASRVVVTDLAELEGLSEAEIASAAAAANAAGLQGKYVLTLLNTSGQPALGSLVNRSLRQRLHVASLSRGSRGGETDTTTLVSRLARLRAERAQLLGYATHADLQLEEQTAAKVETVNRLLAELAAPAVANARREAADIQAIIDREKGG